MDWLESMNRVAGYMEEHLTERVSYGAMARMTGCSVYEFSRLFSFMTGMSLSEYIRRRRLSQAVFDLQAGDRVVDVGLKYGYDSPTAFARKNSATRAMEMPMVTRAWNTPLTCPTKARTPLP